jgi:hypothetical protein
MEIKKLSMEEMEVVEGGGINRASAICSAGFAGYAGILSWGFWAAGVATGGIGIAVGVGIGLTGALVCSFA